jgi:hypothetical protein
MQPFAEGSTDKLAEACRRFLINPGEDKFDQIFIKNIFKLIPVIA